MTTKKTVNGQEIKITNAGYFYIDGVKQSERKIDPFYHGQDVCSDENVINVCRKWTIKNYRMV